MNKSSLLIISIFLISFSFEARHNGKNSLRFLEEDEETDLNMTSLEPEEEKDDPKPILLGFNFTYSNDGNNLESITMFFKNIKTVSKTLFKNYIYFLVNYIPNKRRRRLGNKSIKHEALKGVLDNETLDKDIVEYDVKNISKDMNGFNLEKNVQFLDQDYDNLTYILEKLDDLVYDEEYIDVMFTPDFNFSITEQYFNPDLFLFFDAKEINHVQQKRIKIIGNFTKDYDLSEYGLLKKPIKFVCVNCFPENIKLQAYFEKIQNSDNYSLIFDLSEIFKVNLEDAYADLNIDEPNLRNLQDNNYDKRIFLSGIKKDLLKINVIPRNSYSKNSDGKLSGGAIAGIVIASIALLAGITILAICLRKKNVASHSSAIEFYNSSSSIDK